MLNNIKILQDIIGICLYKRKNNLIDAIYPLYVKLYYLSEDKNFLNLLNQLNQDPKRIFNESNLTAINVN